MANQPKNYKKFVATAATATLVASAIVPVASAASFSDIEGNTHADAIKSLVEQGIINGYADGTFKPNNQITRGQTVKLLGRWLESKGYEIPADYNTVQRFNDVPVDYVDQELVKYAALAYDAGAFKGNNGNLNANQAMSRQNMAVVLVRAIKEIEGVDLVKEYKDADFSSNIKDLDKVSDNEKREAIIALEYAGITLVDNFNPTGTVTRGQFASFLYRTINEVQAEVKVESVKAINSSTFEVTLKENEAGLTADDFTITIDGKEITPISVTEKENGKKYEIKVADLDGKKGTFAVDGVSVAFDYASAISTVTAENGKVTVVFNKAPETNPVVGDFKIERTVNNSTVEIIPTGYNYDVATKTATFTVSEVPAASTTQTVKIDVTYKQEEAKSASFTVPAATAGALKYIGTDPSAGTITLFFDKPLNATVAQNLGNYIWDNNRHSGANTPVFPTAVTLNTAAVGSFGVNQVVTLTFSSGLAANQEGTITVQNLKDSLGLNIPTTTRNVDVINGADAAGPVVTPRLKAGSQQNALNVIVNPGETVELTTTATDDLNGVVSLRYRLQNPDGSLTGWTNLDATDGSLGDKSETAIANIKMPTGTTGTYRVQVQAIDANQVETLDTTATITVNGADIVAPVVNVTSATYNAAPTGTAPARSVTVNANIADALNKVKSVEYRVQEYNAATGAFDTVIDWKKVGAPVDGAYDELVEEVSFTTPQLAPNKDYRIQLRATDVVGNVTPSPFVALPQASITGSFAAANGGGANAFNVPAAETNIPTITGPVYGVADGSRVRTLPFSISATANDDAGVAKVEYAIYKDNDNDGTYETLVTPFSATGVQPTDGQWGGTTEAYTITGSLPNVDGAYRIVTRVTDTSGNVNDTSLAVAQYNLTLDTTSPTVGFQENTATILKNDVIITFSEGMNVTAGTLIASDGATSADVYDPDNYVVVRNGVVVNNPVTAITALPATNQFLVTFTTELQAGDQIRIVEVEDAVGNKINPNPTIYTFQAK